MLKVFVAQFITLLVSANMYWRDEVYEASRNEVPKAVSRDPNEHIFIHAVAHTHDDVGWLKTVDQYYSGSDERDQRAQVNLILTTVVRELINHPSRKFTYVEMKFFTMWYNYQSDEVKDQVKQLIKEGRFEFVNGGWSMHDEATPHYEDMINNMMHGHDFLKKEFDVVPRIGWHVDPFGHSAANARLFADMGFEAWFFARLDYQDKNQRLKDKSMNFLWRPFEKHFGKEKQIFTSAMRDHYCWIGGEWYDERFTDDDPVVVRKDLDTFNADKKVKEIVDYINQMKGDYRGNQMLMPFGCDFTFANAAMNFENMDKLITYFNKHNKANMTMLYSTPGTYIDSLHAQDITWPTKYDDMFPYGDNPQDYWTGYFSSRQAAKKQVRDGQANLHASAQFLSKAVVEKDVKEEEVELILKAKAAMLDWMGVYQHHDAISGTAKQHVANNYVEHLSKAMNQNNEVYGQELLKTMAKTTGISAEALSTCTGAQNNTIHDCPISQHKDQKQFMVLVHNPAAQTFKQLVHIQLPSDDYSAETWSSEEQKFVKVHSDILNNHHFNRKGDKMSVDYEMYLPYTLQPNQVGYVRVSKTGKKEQPKKSSSGKVKLELIKADSNDLEFQLTRKTQEGTMSQNFNFDIKYYLADQGNDGYKDSSNASEGAYILKPERFQRWQYPFAKLESEHYVQDLQNIKQWTFLYANRTDDGSYAVVKVKFYPEFSDLVEFVVELNGIPVDGDKKGKDVTVNWRLGDEFDSNSTFWTDSNGLEMQERILNYRPTWEYSGEQNISSNYYPVASAIAMRDTTTKRQVTVLNERSQAGSANLVKSSIELIQNRRTTKDDNRGVCEPLNERDADGIGIKVNARYYLEIFDYSKEKSQQRQQQLLIDQPLQLFFAFTYKEGKTPKSIPSHLSLADFDEGKYIVFPLAKNKILARFENVGDKFDDEEGIFGDGSLKVDINKFAKEFYSDANGESAQKVTIVEVDLTNNQAWTEMEAKKSDWTWKGEDDDHRPEPIKLDPVYQGQDIVTLEAQRIRSFVIEYEEEILFLQA